MASIRDDRGFNQGFKPGKTLTIRTERRCDWIISDMNLSGEKNILEIGCGTGELSSLLAAKTGQQVLGTDICVPFIEEAVKNYKQPNLEFQVLDFHEPWQLGNRKFDYIVGNGILHHLYNHLDHSLKALYSLLEKGGRIIFLEPNVYNPYCFLIFRTRLFRKMANLEPDEMAFSKTYITRKLKQNAFLDIKVVYKDFLLPNTPGMLVKPIIAVGAVVEKIPVMKCLSQSLFISAGK